MTLNLRNQTEFDNRDDYKEETLQHIISGIEEITSKGAFEDWTNLISAEIGDGVKSIGDFTFSNCGILEAVIIGNDVKIIDSYAFVFCCSLRNITTRVHSH